jgi:hypothetical protein
LTIIPCSFSPGLMFINRELDPLQPGGNVDGPVDRSCFASDHHQHCSDRERDRQAGASAL